MSYIFPSGSSQGLLFSNHAVVLCSCWHLLCLGFWPTGFENVLSLREVFVGSCFPSFTLSSLWRYTEYSSNVDLPLLLKFCLLHLPPDTHCEFRPMSRLPILQPVCAAPPPPAFLNDGFAPSPLELPVGLLWTPLPVVPDAALNPLRGPGRWVG